MNPFATLELEMDVAKIRREKREADQKANADLNAKVAALQHEVAKIKAIEALQREKIETLEHKVEVLIAHAKGVPFRRKG